MVYQNAIAEYPGEEFIVSERGKMLPDPLGGPPLRVAGQAYSYRGH
jgi:hypothetical protein